MAESRSAGDVSNSKSAIGAGSAAVSFTAVNGIAANGTPQPASGPEVKVVKKRLFICCDGTWNDGINNRGPLTNVSRLARCVEGVAGDYLQIVYYDSGVGNGTALPSQTVDGATGRGTIVPNSRLPNCILTLFRNIGQDQKRL